MRELHDLLQQLGARARADSVTLWLLTGHGAATTARLAGDDLAAQLGLAAIARRAWSAEHGDDDVLAPPSWPESLPDPRVAQPTIRLVREGAGRWATWLQTEGELVGLLQIDGPPRARAPSGIDGLLRATVAAANRLWRAMGLGAVETPVWLVLTPDGAFSSGVGRARLGEHADELRALCDGPAEATWGAFRVEREPLFADGAGDTEATSFLLRLTAMTRVPATPRLMLSERQREVAELAAAGLRIAEIAERLGCAASTVKTHLRMTYQLLGVSNRVELQRALHSER